MLHDDVHDMGGGPDQFRDGLEVGLEERDGGGGGGNVPDGNVAFFFRKKKLSFLWIQFRPFPGKKNAFFAARERLACAKRNGPRVSPLILN